MVRSAVTAWSTGRPWPVIKSDTICKWEGSRPSVVQALQCGQRSSQNTLTALFSDRKERFSLFTSQPLKRFHLSSVHKQPQHQFERNSYLIQGLNQSTPTHSDLIGLTVGFRPSLTLIWLVWTLVWPRLNNTLCSWNEKTAIRYVANDVMRGTKHKYHRFLF